MTNLIRFSPASDMRCLQREIDQVFDTFFPNRNGENGSDSAVWSPRVDLSETDDLYLIHLDLPGLRKEDVEINFQNGQLTVSGERRLEETEKQRKYVRVERSYGKFFRSFALPKLVNADKIEATFEHGELTIHVPKAEESKPRRIEVS